MAGLPESRHLDRIKDFLMRLSSMESLNDPVIKRRILYGAIVFFLGGIIVSLRAQPDILGNISLLPMVFIVAGVFVTLALSAVEFQITAAICGSRISFVHAFETIVIGNAANMLPLPGNIAVKISRLKSLGIHYKHGASITVLMAIIGLGLVLIYAGFWMLSLTLPVIAWGVLLAGLLVFVAAFYYTLRALKDIGRLCALVALRLALIIFHAARLFLCIGALGIAGGFAHASVLTVSGVLSSAIAVVPAGMGLQELFAAGIGPLIGITAASSFLISSLNRILGMMTVFTVSGLLALWMKKEG